MPSASEITVSETLTLLDGQLREFADAISNDCYAVWLGAGISLGKLPGLAGVAEAVLEHVRAAADPANPHCPFRDSLDRILALVALSPDQKASIDYSAPVGTWPPIAEIRQQLVNRYGTMLDQFPATESADYLVWEAVRVVERYADPATTPGPEHLGLAALIMEGVASDSASANWDDLIEKAMRVLGGDNTTVLQVRVLPEDVQDNLRRARLYKFHGCAALAEEDEGLYRDRIVARDSQIQGWALKPENHVIAGKLLDLATSKHTLMLGLSAQDTNIQALFVAARTQLPATFPTHPAAVMVSEDQVGPHQRSLLQNFYRNDYAAHSVPINAASLVRAYARSLLPALWLYVLCAKFSALIDAASPGLPQADRDGLRQGLDRLRDLAAQAADPTDHEAYMLAALSIAGRSMRLFRRGRAAGPAEGVYTPMAEGGVARVLADPQLDSSGLVELALALALIGCGEAAGHWTCAAQDPAEVKAGAVLLTGASGVSAVFFAASSHAAAKMFEQGHVADDDDAVLIHSFDVPARAARHPSSAPGRTGIIGLREFSVSSISEGAVSLQALMERFTAEMAL